MAVKGSVPPAGVIVPHLVVADAGVALDFHQRAFDAELLDRSTSPSGDGEHIHPGKRFGRTDGGHHQRFGLAGFCGYNI